MDTNKPYYDIDIDWDFDLSSAALDDVFFMKDLERRKFYLNANVDQYTIHQIARHILQLNKEDEDILPEKRKPILLYVASNGGEVDSGFELIDIIENSVTPVYTVNIGFQYSMGFLIGLAGHKRYAMPNAKFLMHDGSNFVYGSGSKVQDQMEFNRRVEQRIKEYVLSHSAVTEEEYDQKYRVEWYLFADEAKEKGFTDYIIGEDCGIDAII